MTKSYPRLTLKDSVTLKGPGLHTGEPTQVTLHPGENGFVFNQNGTKTEAKPENVTDTSRCTMLGTIGTVEHVLSALAGLGLTDAEIEVQGSELPAADGCALPYVEAINQVGTAPCGTLEVEGPFARVFHVVDNTRVKYAIGLGEGYWRNLYELDDYFTGAQEYELAWTPEKYAQEIAPARTVVLEHEIEAVKALGLGKGLDESSCLAIGKTNYLNPARFPDEPTRHKLLDLIGDLALTGIPIAHLDVVGEWTGHKHNLEAAQKLTQKTILTRHPQ